MRENGSREIWAGPRYWPRRRGINALISATEILQQLVFSGSPMPEGLLACTHDVPDRRLRQLLLAVHADLVGGRTLHEALERRPAFFPRFYCDLVRTGEESGKLDECLRELREDLLSGLGFRDTLMGHALYMGTVLVVELNLLAGLLVFVFPQWQEIFRSFGRSPSRSLDTLALVNSYVEDLIMPAMMLLLVGGWYVFWYSPSARERLTQFAVRVGFRIPAVRGILIKRNLAHVASVLGRLLEAGAPIDRALETTAALDVNPVYKRWLSSVQGRIMQGHSFRESLEFDRKLAPASFLGLAALGESSGRLPETLGQIARLYRREVLRTSRVLLDLTAPLGVLGIGALVFWVYFALWTSIIQLPLLVQASEGKI